MAWSIKPAGSWGVCTTTAPASETAAALARPGSWLYDTNPFGGAQRVYVRKDQWFSLAAAAGVDSIIPSQSSAAGGTPVVILGEGLTGSTGVTFGGTAGTAFSVVSDSEIHVTTPAHAAGPVNVVVANPRGNVTVVNGFTFT